MNCRSLCLQRPYKAMRLYATTALSIQCSWELRKALCKPVTWVTVSTNDCLKSLFDSIMISLIPSSRREWTVVSRLSNPNTKRANLKADIIDAPRVGGAQESFKWHRYFHTTDSSKAFETWLHSLSTHLKKESKAFALFTRVAGDLTPTTALTISTASDLLENGSAHGELGHIQGRTDDGFDVSDVDFARHIQSAASATFDHIALLVAHRGFD